MVNIYFPMVMMDYKGSYIYIYIYMGASENVVYPIVPNGVADHYPVFKWLAIIGKINPTFSVKAIL